MLLKWGVAPITDRSLRHGTDKRQSHQGSRGIRKAVEQIRKEAGKSIKIEVETTNLEEVHEALEMKVDMIMLDNMTNQMMSEAVKAINGKAKVEASGNMTLERIKEVAETGVDYISIGALTHSVTAMDISMNIEEIKE